MKVVPFAALPILVLVCAGVRASDAATTGAAISGGEQRKAS